MLLPQPVCGLGDGCRVSLGGGRSKFERNLPAWSKHADKRKPPECPHQAQPAVSNLSNQKSAYALSFDRPLARRLFRIRRPAFVAIRARNPWRFLRTRLDGWNVRFIACPPVGGQIQKRIRSRTTFQSCPLERGKGRVNAMTEMKLQHFPYFEDRKCFTHHTRNTQN